MALRFSTAALSRAVRDLLREVEADAPRRLFYRECSQCSSGGGGYGAGGAAAAAAAGTNGECPHAPWARFRDATCRRYAEQQLKARLGEGGDGGLFESAEEAAEAFGLTKVGGGAAVGEDAKPYLLLLGSGNCAEEKEVELSAGAAAILVREGRPFPTVGRFSWRPALAPSLPCLRPCSF